MMLAYEADGVLALIFILVWKCVVCPRNATSGPWREYCRPGLA